jgi:hypothetical protein
MQDFPWVAVAAILLISGAAFLAKPRRAGACCGERGLPEELAGADIAYAERTFRSEGLGLVARIDRAYGVEGQLQLVELKTRARDVVYPSDIVELSVQRVVVMEETNQNVSLLAWVVVQDSRDGVRRSHVVRLMSRGQVVKLADRYRRIIHGDAADLKRSRFETQCRACAHRAHCSAAGD